MKTIRYLTTGLLFLAGVLHIYLSIAESTQEQFVPTLIFGIVYCILGFLIMSKKRFAIWIGLILPFLPLIGSLVKVDFKSSSWVFQSPVLKHLRVNFAYEPQFCAFNNYFAHSAFNKASVTSFC